MSTNEENKNEDISQHEQQTLETSKLSEKTSINLTGSEDGISKGETEAKKDNILSSFPGDGNPDAGNRNPVISGSDVSDNEGKNQTGISPSNEEVKSLTNETELGSCLDDNSEDKEMSRSNVKSKVPRSNLPLGNAKASGELTGQPSVNKNKEDVYWKNREQELLGKIAALEDRVKEAEALKYLSVDQAAIQRQEKLEQDLSTVTQQREHYKNRLEALEKEVEKKSKDGETNDSHTKNSDEIIQQLKDQNQDLRGALTKMTTILKDKSALCVSQEKKMAALNHQVDSLKEVVTITKDLLNIRNMEVQHLSADISVMETKIDCERQRHNQMLVKMDEAVKLNSELKREYESQLKIFKDLRENYEEKVRLLSGGESTLDKREENANIQTTGSENDKSSTGTPNTEISDYKR